MLSLSRKEIRNFLIEVDIGHYDPLCILITRPVQHCESLRVSLKCIIYVYVLSGVTYHLLSETYDHMGAINVPSL